MLQLEGQLLWLRREREEGGNKAKAKSNSSKVLDPCSPTKGSNELLFLS